ncbi:MAG: hypothetical protein VX527_10080, partial [Planctomycetota bacterium]|nr:hypothetical protein [Planctomycetota bacterium]
IGDLLWWAEEYNRIAIWIVGPDNFLAGDYLTYNGQEVIIDATLGGIGTYTTNGHVNLVWNDGQGVVNWQMDRGGTGLNTPSQNDIPLENDFPLDNDFPADNPFDDDDDGDDGEGGPGFRADGDDDGLDGDPVDNADEDGLEEETLGDQTPATTTTTTTNFANALNYRIAGAWRMNPDGTLTEMNIEIFAGLPPDLGTLPGEGGGLGDLGGFDDFDFGGLPDFGDLIPGGDDDDSDGGLIGAITIPGGMDPCDYICSLDQDDPSTWPPEFLGPPASIIQGIWEILIGGLLESFGCAPCAGGGGGGDSNAVGACCNAEIGACAEFTEAECNFPGATWLGAGTTCEDDCN